MTGSRCSGLLPLSCLMRFLDTLPCDLPSGRVFHNHSNNHNNVAMGRSRQLLL